MRREVAIPRNDPRTPGIVAAMKKAGNCDRISNLRESQGEYRAQGFRKIGKGNKRSWELMGDITLAKESVK